MNFYDDLVMQTQMKLFQLLSDLCLRQYALSADRQKAAAVQ